MLLSSSLIFWDDVFRVLVAIRPNSLDLISTWMTSPTFALLEIPEHPPERSAGSHPPLPHVSPQSLFPRIQITVFRSISTFTLSAFSEVVLARCKQRIFYCFEKCLFADFFFLFRISSASINSLFIALTSKIIKNQMQALSARFRSCKNFFFFFRFYNNAVCIKRFQDTRKFLLLILGL